MAPDTGEHWSPKVTRAHLRGETEAECCYRLPEGKEQLHPERGRTVTQASQPGLCPPTNPTLFS